MVSLYIIIRKVYYNNHRHVRCMLKACIIVDGSNLFLGGKRTGKKFWPPELFSRIRPYIGRDVEDICKVHYFTSVNESNAGEQRAHNAMSKDGVIVYGFPLRMYTTSTCPDCDIICQRCGRDLRNKIHREKMIDIAIATKMIELAYQPQSPDIFIIISGDKDLIPAIRLIRSRLGKEVIIAGYRHKDLSLNSLAHELDKEVDHVINLIDI